MIKNRNNIYDFKTVYKFKAKIFNEIKFYTFVMNFVQVQ